MYSTLLCIRLTHWIVPIQTLRSTHPLLSLHDFCSNGEWTCQSKWIIDAVDLGENHSLCQLRRNLSISWLGSMSGSVCSFLFRPEKFNATLKKKWSSTGLQQTAKTFSVGAYISLGIPSFWLPEMVQPLILNPPMSTSFSMFCVTLSALFLAPTPWSCHPCRCFL